MRVVSFFALVAVAVSCLAACDVQFVSMSAGDDSERPSVEKFASYLESGNAIAFVADLNTVSGGASDREILEFLYAT